jgi:hypothetical protein
MNDYTYILEYVFKILGYNVPNTLIIFYHFEIFISIISTVSVNPPNHALWYFVDSFMEIRTYSLELRLMKET